MVFYFSFFFCRERQQQKKKNLLEKKTLFGETDDARFRGATTFDRGIDIWKLLVTHTTPSHHRSRHLAGIRCASLRGDQNQRPHECVQLKKINIPAATRARTTTRIFVVRTKRPCVVTAFPVAHTCGVAEKRRPRPPRVRSVRP